MQYNLFDNLTTESEYRAKDRYYNRLHWLHNRVNRLNRRKQFIGNLISCLLGGLSLTAVLMLMIETALRWLFDSSLIDVYRNH